jgi:hypothetical protein
MEECIYETYCGLCDVLMEYKTGHKSEFASLWSETYKTGHESGHESEFASLWSETTLESFLKARGINYEKNDLNMKCHNFQDKVATIGSYE